MNRGRKIKHSLNMKNEENNSPKNETTATAPSATKHKLLTPCRRVGLNRKRKNLSGFSLSGSSSEINISSPNNSLTEIDISVNEHDFTADTNKINIETPVLAKNMKPRKNNLGARKRTNQTPITNNDVLSSEEILKKYKHLYNIISDVSVVLTRCDFDKHILNRSNVRESSVDISMRIENEAISSTPVETNNSEIQTNQISTTVEEDATPTENNSLNEFDVTEKNLELTEKNVVKVTEKSVEITEKKEDTTHKSVTSKKIKDLFGDNSDDSDFQSNSKPKKTKRFNLKTKTNKRDTLFNENTNDDSTQNSQNSLEGTDTEISKNKTEKNKKIDENLDKKKKTKSNKNSEDTNDLLNEQDQDILTPKTKPSKEDKNKFHKRVIDSQIDSDEIPELNVGKSRKKRKRSSSHNKKSPKINRKPRLYNSDSDDDFMEKPRREKKDPDIKKKINIPAPDPLNRIEHIRIRENKSYTIMHMNNISSYIKYYDNDVNLKRTESDDNQQTTSQPVVSNAKTSMILERKDYLNKGSQENNQNSETSSIETPANEISDCIENSEHTNEISDCNENSETTNVVNDSIENPETTNLISDNITEFSNDVERISAVSDNIENSETNVVSDSFAGFSNNVESPQSAEIHHFRGNIFSNDIENSNSNDIENSNFNDIENSNSNNIENSNFNVIENPNFNVIENPNFNIIENSNSYCTIEKQPPEAVDDFEKHETVSDVENSDEPQNEMKRLLKLKSHLINQIKMKRDKLDSLKRIMAYKEEHNLDDLTKTTLQFKYTLQEALVDLLSHLKTHTERNFNMLLLLGFLKIPSEMVGYNDETKSFE